MPSPTSNSKQKRIRLKAGDVFEMPVSNGKFGYGTIIVCRKIIYVIIHKRLYLRAPAIGQLTSDEIAFVGWTMDAMIYHGDWTVVLHDYPTRSDIPYPNWKVELEGQMVVTDFTGERFLGPIGADEVDLLDFQTSRSPMVFQHALEALHGLGEWNQGYVEMTPAYAFERMTRNQMAP
jgi:hypothetical protein